MEFWVVIKVIVHHLICSFISTNSLQQYSYIIQVHKS